MRSSAAPWPRWKNRSSALERRGISLRAHAVRQDPATRPTAGLSRLPRHAGALVHHPRGARRVPRPAGARGGRGTEAGRRALGRRNGPRAAAGRPPEQPDERRARRQGPASCTSSSSTRSARSTASWPTCASMGFEIDSLIPAGADRHGGAALPFCAAARLTTGLEDLRGLLAGRPRRRREGPADHPLQGSGRNERRRAARHDARPRPTARSCR